MSDPTEVFRMIDVAIINSQIESDNEKDERRRLEVLYGAGNVWDTDEVCREFEIVAFFAPYCRAIRKTDGMKGFLSFQHSPRFYFDFKEN